MARRLATDQPRHGNRLTGREDSGLSQCSVMTPEPSSAALRVIELVGIDCRFVRGGVVNARPCAFYVRDSVSRIRRANASSSAQVISGWLSTIGLKLKTGN